MNFPIPAIPIGTVDLSPPRTFYKSRPARTVLPPSADRRWCIHPRPPTPARYPGAYRTISIPPLTAHPDSHCRGSLPFPPYHFRLQSKPIEMQNLAQLYRIISHKLGRALHPSIPLTVEPGIGGIASRSVVSDNITSASVGWTRVASHPRRSLLKPSFGVFRSHPPQNVLGRCFMLPLLRTWVYDFVELL